MSENQVVDILSYNPKIAKTNVKPIEYKEDKVEIKLESSCYSSINNDRPSVTILSLKENTINSKILIDELKKNASSDNISIFDDEIDKMIYENDNIKGNPTFEVYKSIKSNIRHIENINNIYKDMLFGDDNPESTEQALFNEIYKLENGSVDDIDRVNYSLMAIDSMVSSILVNYSNFLHEIDVNFYNILYNEIDYLSTNISKDGSFIFERKFNSINESNIINRNQRYNDLDEQIEYNLINIFLQRDEVERTENIYKNIDVNDISEYAKIVMEEKDKAIDICFEMIEDLMKNTLLKIVNVEEYFKTLTEKDKISKYYNISIGGM